MAFLLPVLGSAIISGGAAVGYLFWPKSTKTFAPCSRSNTQQGLVDTNTLQFSLPNVDKTCSEAPRTYNMIYFSPRTNMATNTNFTVSPTAEFNPVINGITQQYRVYSPTNLLSAQWLNGGLNNVYAWIENFQSADRTKTQQPLNGMPNYVGLSTIEYATATSLPWNPENGALSTPSLWLFPGAETGNPENVPATTGTALTTILYIYCVQATSLYIEVGGAYGGDFVVYANGANPLSGVSPPIDPGFTGGRPGIVYGLYYVKPGDVLKVYLGSRGQERNNADGSLDFSGNGQGGLATIFGGSNGGGASYIYHYVCTNFTTGPWQALDDAVQNKPGKMVCVAAGGGGASRNASGGSAGLSETPTDPLIYGSAISTGTTGSAGGLNNVTGNAPFKAQIKVNDFSGGGGGITIGGRSIVPDQTPIDGSNGTRLQPFLDSGGGSVETSSGSGGGGGGGGLFGGGAGAWNSIAKPNNLHGAGGGGASTRGLLQAVSKPQNVSFNVYRGTWDLSGKIWKTPRDGYLVLGLPLAS